MSPTLDPPDHETYGPGSVAASRLARGLHQHGLRAADAVIICLPCIPERAISFAACRQLGAHPQPLDVGGLDHLPERLRESQAKALIIADWHHTNAALQPAKWFADRASIDAPQLDLVIVVRHLGRSITWLDGRDVWWHLL